MHVDCLAVCTLHPPLSNSTQPSSTCCSIILLDRSTCICNCFRFCYSHFINFANKIQTVWISCIFHCHFCACFLFFDWEICFDCWHKKCIIHHWAAGTGNVIWCQIAFVPAWRGVFVLIADISLDTHGTFCEWVLIYCTNLAGYAYASLIIRCEHVVACETVKASDKKRTMKYLLTHVIMFISSCLTPFFPSPPLSLCVMCMASCSHCSDS